MHRYYSLNNLPPHPFYLRSQQGTVYSQMSHFHSQSHGGATHMQGFQPTSSHQAPIPPVQPQCKYMTLYDCCFCVDTSLHMICILFFSWTDTNTTFGFLWLSSTRIPYASCGIVATVLVHHVLFSNFNYVHTFVFLQL